MEVLSPGLWLGRVSDFKKHKKSAKFCTYPLMCIFLYFYCYFILLYLYSVICRVALCQNIVAAKTN